MISTSGSSAPDPASVSTGDPGVLCRPAEEAFRKGLAALRNQQIVVARALFEAAIQIERRSGATRVQPRYMSYFGLTLLEDPSRRSMALDCCRRAMKEEFFNPELCLNLSRVYWKLGNRAEAVKSASRGLALDPNHGALRGHVRTMGVRGRPVLPFLHRDNPLNVTLGKMLRKGPVRPGARA